MPIATCLPASRGESSPPAAGVRRGLGLATDDRNVLASLPHSEIAASEGPDPHTVLTSGPDSDWEAIHRLHVAAIHAAAIGFGWSRPTSCPAAARWRWRPAFGGLDVRLLVVPRQSDSRLVTLAARSYFDTLWRRGSKVCNTARACCKAVLVDDDLAMVGGANFDHHRFASTSR